MVDDVVPTDAAGLEHRCPICGAPVAFQPRYPRALCRDCARRATDVDGRPVEFGNEGLSGGFTARYVDTHEPYLEHACFVDGVTCRADEARFGSIVVETLDASAAPDRGFGTDEEERDSILDRIEKTRDVYDAVATEYATRIGGELSGKPLDRALLDLFAASIGRAGRVCDAGCGPGHVARYLRDRDVNVHGLDLSPAMVDEAARLHPDISFRVGDLTSLEGEPTDLAGIVAFYSLIHLPREVVPSTLSTMRRHLAPGGIVFLAFHIGRDCLHLDEWWGMSVSIDFTFFEIEEMRGFAMQSGLAIEWVVERAPYADVEHPTRRGYILARKD